MGSQNIARGLLCALLLSGAGCAVTPIETRPNTNKDVTVELISEFDGLRLYRCQQCDGWHVGNKRGAGR
jgi:hypothetical protein